MTPSVDMLSDNLLSGSASREVADSMSSTMQDPVEEKAGQPTPPSHTSPDPVLPIRRSKRHKAKTRSEWTQLLNEQLSIKNPENPSKQIKLVRHCCQAIGIPTDRRGEVWKILLGLNKRSRPHEPLPKTVGAPLYNQKTINLDVERTRPTLPPFHEPKVRKSMELVLTEYCRRRHLSYVQGMNYVLCPFYLLGIEDNDEIYRVYDTFVRTYLPNTFTDSEFGALQCIFRLFKLLLQYHDPELSAYLDQHEIPPEIYASEWFMTIYGQKCPMETLLNLWDELLLNPDPRFHYFVSLELLRGQKAKLMTRNVEELPEFLSTVTIQDKDQVRRLFHDAKKTSSLTPNTFHDLLHKCTMQKVVVDGALYTELTDLQCMPIEPKELIEHCYSDALEKTKKSERRRRKSLYRKPNKIKYFVIDSRPLEQYEAGHLPVAFHLNPALSSEAMREKLDSLLSMKGSAFCLFFDGVPSKRTDILLSSHLLYFLNKRVKYVSICRGGYCGIHQLLSAGGELELVDHDQSRCLECNGNKKGASSFLKKLYGAADAFRPKPRRSYNTDTVPKAVKMLTPSVDALLTMTLLRNKDSGNERFHKASDRMLARMVAEALEKASISQLQVESCMHTAFDGVQTVKSIYGVAMDKESEACLKNALDLYKPVARTLVGQLTIEEKKTKDERGVFHSVRSAVAYTPKDIEDRMVLVFAPVLEAKNDIHSAVEALLQLGARDLTVLTFVASRPSLWVLCDQFSNFSDVRVLCAAVDGLQKGRITPGIGNFSERYRSAAPPPSGPPVAFSKVTMSQEFLDSEQKRTPNSKPPPGDTSSGQRDSFSHGLEREESLEQEKLSSRPSITETDDGRKASLASLLSNDKKTDELESFLTAPLGS